MPAAETPIRAASLCSGVGAPEVAMPAWDWLWCAEVEAFPSAVLAARHGHPNLGDITAPDFVARALAIGIPDVLVAGTPCFPAGTMIATTRGFVPIEEVRVGDHALTHLGRFRPVVATGSKTAPLWRLRGQGHPAMLTTAEHPFLSRARRARTTRRGGRSIRESWWSDPEWIAAEQMAGRHWALPASFPALPIPAPEARGNETVVPAISPDLLWLAGAYAGDGWVRISDRRGSTIFGISDRKELPLSACAAALGLAFTRTDERTGPRLTMHGRALARWLRDEFGEGAEGKRVPLWLLGAPEPLRRAFLDGYAATDGSTDGTAGWVETRAISVSRQLALGVRSLAITLGYAASVGHHAPAPTKIIEGRTVNQRPYWTVTVSGSARTSVEMAGVRWQLVRAAAPTGESAKVFDLTVGEDHSYVADGIVVHNCQAFSVAGHRDGLADDRGNLTLRGLDIYEELDRAARSSGARPVTYLWENVPGVLSDRTNAFGCLIAGLVGHDSPLAPPSGQSWPDAGMVSGPARRAAWRVLDAQYLGLAQRRARVFVVASARGGADPAQVLLERAGVRRNPPSRREAGQDAARDPGRGAAPGGRDDAAGGGTGRGIGGAGGGGVAEPVPIAETGKRTGASTTSRKAGDGFGAPGDPMFTLGADSRHGVAQAFGGNNTSGPIEVAPALLAQPGSGWKGDFDSETFIAGPAAPFSFKPAHFTRGKDGAPSDISPPLSADADKGDQDAILCAPLAFWHEGATFRPHNLVPDAPPIAFGAKDSEPRAETDLSLTLRAMAEDAGHANGGGQVAVALPYASATEFLPQSSRVYSEGEPAPTLQATGARNGNRAPQVRVGWRVRRLTPMECERLQGFPDGYTRIAIRRYDARRITKNLPEDRWDADGEGWILTAADGPRYKALGNSMAVPVMRWIMSRLEAELRRDRAS